MCLSLFFCQFCGHLTSAQPDKPHKLANWLGVLFGSQLTSSPSLSSLAIWLAARWAAGRFPGGIFSARCSSAFGGDARLAWRTFWDLFVAVWFGQNAQNVATKWGAEMPL